MADEEKRCVDCVHNEEHLKAIQEGKQGSAWCMLECNASHSCFEPIRKMTNEEIDKMADDFVNAQEFTKVYGFARKAECGAFWKYGFLAGLKAGRPQWHILAEEPDVLPEEGQKVKVLTEEGNIEKSTYFYDTYYEEFAFSNIGLLKVFAWCEILTFDKEIEK